MNSTNNIGTQPTAQTAPKPVCTLNNLLGQFSNDIVEENNHLNTLEQVIESLETINYAPVECDKERADTIGDSLLNRFEHLIGTNNNNQHRLYSLINRL